MRCPAASREREPTADAADSQSLKVILAVGAVMDAGLHATGLEICVRSRRGRGRAAELFGQLDVAVNDAAAPLDVGFRGE
jgi:hypothetical protein